MVEALCEFLFEGEWNWIIPGRLSERLETEYPERREVKSGDSTRIQLLAPEITRGVQIGENWLGVHRMQPYEDWTQFKTQIKNTLALYREIAAPEKLRDVNLYFRYQIQLPPQGAPLPLAQLLPQFPADTSLGYKHWMSWNQTITVDRREKRGIAALESGAFFDPSRIPPRFFVVDVQRGVGVGVSLNLQFGFNDEKNLEWGELSDWLETAHEELKYLWAHSVSDSMQEFMGENGGINDNS